MNAENATESGTIRELVIGEAGQALSLYGTTPQPCPTPCPDCGRTYLNGENVTMTAPGAEGGTRVVWSGCCDCWVRRTSPVPSMPEEGSDD